jgi:hypothetical protein
MAKKSMVIVRSRRNTPPVCAIAVKWTPVAIFGALVYAVFAP